MREIWARIEKWLAENTPEDLEILNSGASLAEIEEAEQFLGVKFPDDAKESYQIHNGQPLEAPGLIDGGWRFLSLARIKDEWNVWKELLDSGTFDEYKSEPEDEIKNDWWNPKWIPLTSDDNGNHFCLDFDPSEKGKSGQIITMWHDGLERELMAESFRDWLTNFADKFEEGIYVYDEEEYYAIVDKTDLL